jgi:hypothetical protein
MDLIARQISYSGSFDSMHGWYIGDVKYDVYRYSTRSLPSSLVEATHDQDNWLREINAESIYVHMIKITNVIYKYGIYFFESKKEAEKIIEWLYGFITMERLIGNARL